MANLIDDLLLYSHVSQRPHQTEQVDLNLAIENVMEDLELDIEEKKAVIHVDTCQLCMDIKDNCNHPSEPAQQCFKIQQTGSKSGN